MVSREEIGRWFDDAQAAGAEYMLVVCDTFDWDDYPVPVKPGDDFAKIFVKHSIDMQKVMECYNLKMDKQEQFSSRGVMNTPPL